MGKTIRTLLNIELYEVTGNEIGELRETAKHDRFLLNEVLPKYCVHLENGNIMYTESYLQWRDSGEEKYLLFNAETTDKLLGDEILQCGLDDLFKTYDFRYVLETFTKNKIRNRFLQLPQSEYLIVELDYIGGGYFNADDVDLEVNPIGKLNLYNIEQ
jgi:hypothetical protein